jgi:hypothetical protein
MNAGGVLVPTPRSRHSRTRALAAPASPFLPQPCSGPQCCLLGRSQNVENLAWTSITWKPISMPLAAPLRHAGSANSQVAWWPRNKAIGRRIWGHGCRQKACTGYLFSISWEDNEGVRKPQHVCLHWALAFLWVADAVRCLADSEHKSVPTPRSTIATAVLSLLGPGFVSLWQCSSGWPAGCSPQIACSVGTGPLRTCQREDHWSRVGTRQFPAGTLRSLCLFTAGVAAGRRNSRKGRRGGGSYGTWGMFVIFLICVVHLAYYPIERQGCIWLLNTCLCYMAFPWSGLENDTSVYIINTRGA